MIVMYLFESQNASFKEHVGVSLLKNKQKHTHYLLVVTAVARCAQLCSYWLKS